MFATMFSQFTYISTDFAITTDPVFGNRQLCKNQIKGLIMKTNQSAKLRAFILAAALIAGFGFVTHAAAQATHSYLIDLNSGTATDLNTRMATDLGRGTSGAATAINDAGQVVGYLYTSRDQHYPFHIFIAGPNGVGMTDLGTLGSYDGKATGINAAGQAVGVLFVRSPAATTTTALSSPASILLPMPVDSAFRYRFVLS